MISPTKIDALTRVFNKFKPAIGRLYRRKDRTFLTGTCFLVAPDHAVTCHHVIRVDQEPVELDLVFEGAPGDFVPVANIHSLGAGIDIADLSLARLVALPFFPLSVSEPWGNPFATFGYPASHGGGGTTTFGEILGPTS